MIQSGGFDFLDLMNSAKVVYKIVNKAKDLCNKVSLDDVIKIADTSKKILSDPKKKLLDPIKFRMGLTLTNNDIKDFMKVIN